jgi:hypothetical protein
VSELDDLIDIVEQARQRFLRPLVGLTTEQAAFRVEPNAWSITQVTEHLVHAEAGGINLIWRAAEGVAHGTPVWSGESPNRGLSIAEVVERTWQPRENSPESALPRIGGPFPYWAAALRGCSGLLAELKSVLRGLALDDVIYPHAISGPLDARQRLEFLAFHLDRHSRQVAGIITHPSFPGGGHARVEAGQQAR